MTCNLNPFVPWWKFYWPQILHPRNTGRDGHQSEECATTQHLILDLPSIKVAVLLRFCGLGCQRVQSDSGWEKSNSWKRRLDYSSGSQFVYAIGSKPQEPMIYCKTRMAIDFDHQMKWKVFNSSRLKNFGPNLSRPHYSCSKISGTTWNFGGIQIYFVWPPALTHPVCRLELMLRSSEIFRSTDANWHTPRPLGMEKFQIQGIMFQIAIVMSLPNYRIIGWLILFAFLL